MKLWVSKNSEVPLRDQLVAQITLGIASTDLKNGEKLPSTRELARRFGIHQNTVSSAYRDLAANGLVEFKKGSGVFVADARAPSKAPRLEKLFEDFFDQASAASYTKQEIESYLQGVLTIKRPGQVLVVESDAALREIMIEEIQAATGLTTEGISFEKFSRQAVADSTRIAAMFDEKEKLLPILSGDAQCVFLNANSVPKSLSGQKRPSKNDLIAIVSGWEKFISFAKLFLLAAKIDPEMFITRHTADRNWKKGIDQAAFVICDSVTAKNIGGYSKVRVFPVIAASSLEQLRRSF